MRAGNNPETAEQEQERIARNIDRMKAQIRELVHENKDIEGNIDLLERHAKNDRTLILKNEIKDMRHHIKRIQEKKIDGNLYDQMESGIKDSFDVLGFEVDTETLQVLKEAKIFVDYKMQVDKPLYMLKPMYIDLRNQIAIAVVAAGKLDFEEVCRKSATGAKVGRSWPEKMCQALKRDVKLASYLNLNQVRAGIEKFQLQGLSFDKFMEDLNISEVLEGVRTTGETELGIGLDALIGEIKRSNEFRLTLTNFLKDSTDVGGLGQPAKDTSLSLVWIPELSFYRNFKNSRLTRPTLFRAMGQLLVYKQKWEFQVDELVDCLENTTYNNEPDSQSHLRKDQRIHQVGSQHDTDYGDEIRASQASLEMRGPSGDSGVAKDYHLMDTVDPHQDKRVLSTQFDKSSELKLKEEVIQFEELPERKSIFSQSDPNHLLSRFL